VGHAVASSNSPTLQKDCSTPSSHRWRAAESIVPTNKIVIGKVQADGGFKVLAFLAEGVRQTANRFACRRVVALKRST
jgi:hypothetical protein